MRVDLGKIDLTAAYSNSVGFFLSNTFPAASSRNATTISSFLGELTKYSDPSLI
jgi:hypothetical protein